MPPYYIAVAGDCVYQGTRGESVGAPWRLSWGVVAFLLVALVNCDATAKRLFSNPLSVITRTEIEAYLNAEDDDIADEARGELVAATPEDVEDFLRPRG
jgi:hypothetical protein